MKFRIFATLFVLIILLVIWFLASSHPTPVETPIDLNP
jgi:hypothetical protein